MSRLSVFRKICDSIQRGRWWADSFDDEQKEGREFASGLSRAVDLFVIWCQSERVFDDGMDMYYDTCVGFTRRFDTLFLSSKSHHETFIDKCN